MIKLHHLEYSRSTRIIWLLEEIGLDYELVVHQRHPQTFRAQADLAEIHPLAKAPTVEIDGQILVESSAIIEYIVEAHSDGRLAPGPGSAGRATYLEWLHFAEGTLGGSILATLLEPRFGGYGPQQKGFVEGELVKLLDYVEAHLDRHDYVAGDAFSAADIHIEYLLELAKAAGMLANRPATAAYVERLQQREAYKKAITLGGAIVPPFMN